MGGANSHTPKLIVLSGQTGSGKSALAQKLARRFDVEVISADSVQVYRGFDIGSAKPTAAERAELPHHLIDILAPDDAIDAAGYSRRADAVIASLRERNKIPLIVGGTGLWIRALLRGLVDLPAVNLALREELEQQSRAVGNDAMHARLAEVDPLSAEHIHPNDTLRIVRALEVYAQTGKALGKLRQEHGLGGPRYRTLMFAIEHPSEELRPKLRARTEHMLASGWIEEVEALLAQWPTNARAFGSVGYREICAHLGGKITRNDLPEVIERETWRYAKRQRNWFRAEPYVDKRGPVEELETAAFSDVEEFLSL